MSFSVYTTEYFDKELKRLSRKYPSLKSDFRALVDSLKEEPTIGQALGKDCYKISDKESISDKEIDNLLKAAGIQ